MEIVHCRHDSGKFVIHVVIRRFYRLNAAFQGEAVFFRFYHPMSKFINRSYIQFFDYSKEIRSQLYQIYFFRNDLFGNFQLGVSLTPSINRNMLSLKWIQDLFMDTLRHGIGKSLRIDSPYRLWRNLNESCVKSIIFERFFFKCSSRKIVQFF